MRHALCGKAVDSGLARDGRRPPDGEGAGGLAFGCSVGCSVGCVRARAEYPFLGICVAVVIRVSLRSVCS